MSPLTTKEPFGIPDGSIGELRTLYDSFVDLDGRYGGISRLSSDAKVRVLVGRLGAGKSLYLRRMQDYQFHQNNSTFAVKPNRNIANLVSSDLAQFARRLSKGSNTENWKVLWRRSVVRSALTYVRLEPALYNQLDQELASELKEHSSFLRMPPRHPRGVVDTAKEILVENETTRTLSHYLESKVWTDLEALLAAALKNTKPLFLYIDAIDDNYRYAPTLWTQCQRGLFYAVMDLLRDDDLSGPLHIVIAVRDITLASIRSSEHAQRYLDYTHISLLNWKRESMRDLLRMKLANLNKAYFLDPQDRTVQSWLGQDTIRSDRPGSPEESLEDYLIRHTRLVPRDLVILGNDLCREIAENSRSSLNASRIKHIVHQNAKKSAEGQISLCANQVVSDMLTDDAVDYKFESLYLQPSEYTLQDAQRKVLECIAVTGADIFDVGDLHAVNEYATMVFERDVHLSDILWQHGLLGITRDGVTGQYFSLTESHTLLPSHTSTFRYVWNPIVFDLDTALECVTPSPVWPE